MWLYLTGKPWKREMLCSGHITTPKMYWKFMPTGDTQLQFSLPTAPNLFHRFMQRLCFGMKWEIL